MTTDRVQHGYSFMKDLTQAWTAERNSPDILPFSTLLIEGAMTRLRAQIDTVESMATDNERIFFKLVIMQIEIERIKFLLRSYLRTRISKIDRYLMFCNRDEVTSGHLSALERHYAEKHQMILERHYHTSFMKNAPESGHLRKLDDTGAAGLSMIDKPNLNRAVFCKIIKPLQESDKLRSEAYDLEVGNTVLIRYNLVKPFLYTVCVHSLKKSKANSVQDTVQLL
ncbi:protein of unknown function [Taphrina deformans PYCC 5710]|uniref:DNA replication complex GINS protein SLD5 n=1 Tax=Taphrina deformans (strain PYCC 5710 / ATCC 11124 / CBS 356.35 / IMI 108563 / JCM 9778 / NBRC 8474) TaxID=1097556 RepID=S0BED8_TAPDE|nr:protein of unknown function [Taphrina deformans PYCC 5710]|eukprot:CCG84882.1 protein of unknown function [Taphrina deformans PYCC 5710]